MRPGPIMERSTNNEVKRNAKRRIAIALLLIVGLSALAAGYGFIDDPSGRALGMSTDYIRHSPFRSFLVPGIVLFTVNGLLAIIAATFTMLRGWRYQDLIFLQGLVLNGWIAVQVVMVRDFNLLHGLCLLIGLLLMRFGRELKAAAH